MPVNKRTYPHVKRGILLALGGGICWGLSGTCVDVLTVQYGVPAEWLTCVRMIFSMVCFLALAGMRNPHEFIELSKDHTNILRIILFAMLGLLLTQYSYMLTIKLTGAGTALLLEQLGLAVVMLSVCISSRRMPNPREMLGLVFAVLGAFLISTQGNISGLAIPLEGLIWGLVSAVALALYNLLPVKPLSRYSAFLVTGTGMFFGSIVSCVVFQPWHTNITVPFEAIPVLGGVVIVGTVFAYVLFMQGIKDAGPVKASLLGSVEPVSAMIISYFWLHTPVSVYDIFGAIAIVVMIALVTDREQV